MEVIWLNKSPIMNLRRGKSFRRKINSMLVGIQSKLQTPMVWGYPRHLIIDVINVCGLHCPICPQGRSEIPRKTARISKELFSDILDRLGPYLYTLTLTNWGEPLRHPDIIDLLRIARKSPAYIGFSSNLQNLSREIVDELLLSGVDEIGCSIDGGTAPTYQKYRVGGDFHVALSNMKHLVDRKRELGLSVPKIRWQVLINRYTEKEIDLIHKTAEEIGVDSVVWVPIYVDIGRMLIDTPEQRFARDKDWLPADEDLSWYDYRTGRFKQVTYFCDKLWDSIVIHPDGAMSPCCAVIDPADDFGKWGSDFFKVWNGQRYRTARKLVKSGKPGDPDIVCSHCMKNGVLIF